VGDNNKQQKPAHLLRELFHGKKKWVTGLVILILVIGVGAGAWLFISIQNKSILQSSESKSNDANLTESKLAIVKDKVTKLDNQAGASPSTEDLSKVQTELTQLTKSATSNEEKQIYLSKSIELYVNSKDYEAALIIAEQLEQANPTAFSADSLALVYMGLGDYKKAAQYYQTAADRSEKTDDPTARSPYNDYIISKRQAEALIK